MGILLASLCLAAILGFAAHRASICTVRAVAEVLSTGRAYCFLSFGKSVLWVAAILFLVILYNPKVGADISGFELSAAACIGGLMFGVGAALNGGCSFSTLSRLADGQLRMLVTLIGFAFGVLMIAYTFRAGYVWRAVSSPPFIQALSPYAGIMALGLWTWCFWELARLWFRRPRNLPFAEKLLVRQYSLSTAAALMGGANGLLYLLHGPWTYTGVLRQGVEGLVIMSDLSGSTRISLFVAVFLGMLLSAWQRGNFRLEGRVSPSWLMNGMGGALMGGGVVLVPGGNDALILFGIPTLSQHALPAYAAMLVGIALVILAMRSLTGVLMHVDCHMDVCRTGSSSDLAS